MNHLIDIVRADAPAAGLQFRRTPYGSDGIASFLRDVLAIANASVEGPRHIVVGMGFDTRGDKVTSPVDRDDFSGKPAYESIASEYIEPPVRLRYQPVKIDGSRVGVYEIDDCRDRPYMMRIDFTESLRRGDAYARVNDAAIKMGRRQLQYLFEKKFRDSVADFNIEVGFPGEIIHKDLNLPTCDLTELPSAVARSKLQELLDLQKSTKNSGATTTMARLTHARLFGSDDPYVERSPAELLEEMQSTRWKYRDQDEYFLFESKAQELQMVIYNQGVEAIRDASLALVLPNHDDFHVAERLPKTLRRGALVDRSKQHQSRYPSVTLQDDSVHISTKVGDIPAGAPVEAFAAAPRLCIGDDLGGRKFRLNYTLFGQNLRTPAKGKLRLLFT